MDLSAFEIPEDLVGVQAYLRWERMGKHNYSPEQEKVCVGVNLCLNCLPMFICYDFLVCIYELLSAVVMYIRVGT